MLLVLKNLGFEAWFNYQKYREEFLHENVVIAIDETPIGTFVELEGTEETIDEMAKLLGQNRETTCSNLTGPFISITSAHRAMLPVTRSSMKLNKHLKTR